MRPKRSLPCIAAAVLLALAAPQAARAQFLPYYGKNNVKYDNFAWQIYKSPHFEIYYYPEFEQHLARLASYAESAYQKVSSDLKHEISFPIPLILYKTHSEYEQTSLVPPEYTEGSGALTEGIRNRMLIPIDEPPDRLQRLIVHELTHVFENDLIPRGLTRRATPLWVDEGLASYEEGVWAPLDLMEIRDAAITDRIPRMSRTDAAPLSGRFIAYNLGHAVFEFIEARFGKEGIRQFLYTLRKGIVGGGVDDIYQQAFRLKPEEFDEQFEKWVKERFKPYRDKQRPSDWGRNLSPDNEKSKYWQVFAFAPSPSGEMAAALTANRADGEADLLLLSTKDRSLVGNLTKGYTNRYDGIAFNDEFVAGRSIGFDPKGDTVAFFARTAKHRSLFLVSVLNHKVVREIPVALDQSTAPCLLADGKRALFSALKDGVSDIYLLDLETGAYQNLTQDSYADSNPQIAGDGKLVVYQRRISGNEKIYVFPLDDPSRKVQLTFGAHNDVTPTFSVDGSRIYYVSNEEDEIYNLRSLDMKTGAIRQYTDALGGVLSPAVLASRGAERVAFISYFKGEYQLQTMEIQEPLKEVEQEVRTVAEGDVVDFQPDVLHQVVSENKRKKKLFEKLYLEGRPPLELQVTSGGDFFGGSQVALSDVLGDKNFVFTAYSVRDLRSYSGSYVDLAKRFQYGVNLFDNTQYFFPTLFVPQSPADFYSRRGAFFTSRLTGGYAIAQYPLDRYRRIEFAGGLLRQRQRYEDPAVEEEIRRRAAAAGRELFLFNGTIAPLQVGIVQETTRFHRFGPLTGSTFSISYEVAPGLAGMLSRQTLDVDARKYFRLGGTTTVFATRIRGFKSWGDNPSYFFFGGNMELRGFPYASLAGNEGFFANAELRFPIIDVAATPIGLIGPIRGVFYAGVGGARFRGEPFRFASRESGVSFVRDGIFGDPVSGFHLVDGRASYGVGLQFFFLGYPMHFDWSKLTDFKVSSSTRFDFWVGFDF